MPYDPDGDVGGVLRDAPRRNRRSRREDSLESVHARSFRNQKESAVLRTCRNAPRLAPPVFASLLVLAFLGTADGQELAQLREGETIRIQSPEIHGAVPHQPLTVVRP
jgi:hypothetical protein